MWQRFRRKSMAPNRPAVFPEQWGLVLVTALVLVGSIVAVILLSR